MSSGFASTRAWARMLLGVCVPFTLWLFACAAPPDNDGSVDGASGDMTNDVGGAPDDGAIDSDAIGDDASDGGSSDNSGAVGDEPDSTRPEPGDVSGLFAENEAWAVISQHLTVLGFGNVVEMVLIDSDEEIVSCIGSNPPAAVNYDGETLSIETEFESKDTDNVCTLTLAAPAAHCTEEIFGLPLTECALTDGGGSATFDRDGVEWTEHALTRFRACTTIPTDLDDEAIWGLYNFHPLLLNIVMDPAAFGATIFIPGISDQMLGGSLFTKFLGEMNIEGCLDETAGGSVEWDGRTLAVDITMDAQDNGGSVGTPGGRCTVRFNGTFSYCITDALSDLPSAANSRFIRIDGAGEFTSPGGDGDLVAMYLLTGPPNGGSTGGGTRPPRR